jgi:SAM-dependent methyltransferase
VPRHNDGSGFDPKPYRSRRNRANYDYATEKEAGEPQGIRYVQADLCGLPDLDGPFDAVVANMVFLDIPDWTGAMRACIAALAPGGLLVFSIIHPCFEQLASSWREHGEHRILREIAEPALDPVIAAAADHGAEAYVHLPNFLVVAARRALSQYPQ